MALTVSPATREEAEALCAKMSRPELAEGFLARRASYREVIEGLLAQPDHLASAAEHASPHASVSPVVAACRQLAVQRLASVGRNSGSRTHVGT